MTGVLASTPRLMHTIAVSTAGGKCVLIIVLILLGVGEFLAFGLTYQALIYPGWAYKQAHRSKALWVLAGLVAFVPLMAYVVLVMWIVRCKAVVRAAGPSAATSPVPIAATA